MICKGKNYTIMEMSYMIPTNFDTKYDTRNLPSTNRYFEIKYNIFMNM